MHRRISWLKRDKLAVNINAACHELREGGQEKDLDAPHEVQTKPPPHPRPIPLLLLVVLFRVQELRQILGNPGRRRLDIETDHRERGNLFGFSTGSANVGKD